MVITFSMARRRVFPIITLKQSMARRSAQSMDLAARRCIAASVSSSPTSCTDPLWDDFRELTKGTVLRACWSTPILSGRGKVLGSFAMYYTEPQAPRGEEARLTEVATRLAAKAIENQALRG